MTARSARERVQKFIEFVPLPQVAVESLRVAPSESAGSQMARLLVPHEETTTHVLRLCNGAFRTPSQPIRNVAEAVERLGLTAIQSLVLGASVRDAFKPIGPACGLDIGQFWRHSLQTALTAQMLAERVGSEPAQEAFAAGLIHDVGLLLMSSIYGEGYRTFLQSEPPSDDWVPHEHDRFGTDHAEAGSIWCQMHGIPDRIEESVRRHHDRGLATHTPAPGEQLLLVVALADRMSQLGIEPHVGLSRRRVESKNRLLIALGLHPVDLTFASCSAIESLHEISTILGIDAGSELDILRDANRRLRESYQELEQLLIESPLHSREELIRQVLDAICATFSHYINNATTTIMGHSELVEMAVRRGTLVDPDGRLVESMRMIENAVVNISAVLTEMKLLGKFEVVPYHDRAQILNIDEKVRRRVEQAQPH
jgi:HD-like signal output (HDOD) protein